MKDKVAGDLRATIKRSNVGARRSPATIMIVGLALAPCPVSKIIGWIHSWWGGPARSSAMGDLIGGPDRSSLPLIDSLATRRSANASATEGTAFRFLDIVNAIGVFGEEHSLFGIGKIADDFEKTLPAIRVAFSADTVDGKVAAEEATFGAKRLDRMKDGGTNGFRRPVLFEHAKSGQFDRQVRQLCEACDRGFPMTHVFGIVRLGGETGVGENEVQIGMLGNQFGRVIGLLPVYLQIEYEIVFLAEADVRSPVCILNQTSLWIVRIDIGLVDELAYAAQVGIGLVGLKDCLYV